MKHLLLLILFFASPYAISQKPKYQNFSRQLFVAGVGQLKFDYLFTGEPVSRPRSLRFHIKCANTNNWKPIGEFQMCELRNYKYDPKDKKMLIEYIDGRVNPQTGESFCDQRGENELKLADICKSESGASTVKPQEKNSYSNR